MMLNILNSTKIIFTRYPSRRLCTLLDSSQISLENNKIVQYLENLTKEFYDLRINPKTNSDQFMRIRQISKVVDTYEKRKCVIKNLETVNDMKNEKDEDMKALIAEEAQVYSNILKRLESELMNELLHISDENQVNSMLFEISAGAGGQEAMIFANELLNMYTNFVHSRGGDIETVKKEHSDLGGLRYVNCNIYGENIYDFLKNEAGIHRVQRVPATEKAGRMHTSTVCVTIQPLCEDEEITLEDKDLEIETKRASGAGGQHVNTTNSAVRITHIPTRTSVECQTDRSQIKNREVALKKLKDILNQRQVASRDASIMEIKKTQTGSKNRNEKIRTYNFVQDRITDHRLSNGKFYSIREFLEGGPAFNNVALELLNHYRQEKLLHIINSS